jgi:hypothetical protein
MTFDCEKTRGLFSEWYDGEAGLDGPEEAAFSGHMEACAACANEFVMYKNFVDGLRALPAPEPPEGFHARLMAEVLKEIRGAEAHAFGKRPASRPTRPFVRWAGLAAACFVAAGLWLAGAYGMPARQTAGETGTAWNTVAPSAAIEVEGFFEMPDLHTADTLMERGVAPRIPLDISTVMEQMTAPEPPRSRARYIGVPALLFGGLCASLMAYLALRKG